MRRSSIKNQSEALISDLGRWPTPHIDARKILDNNSLADPLQLSNAILIYPTPLFIGLETDAVVYISAAEDYGDVAIQKVRSAHHFLAISRAKQELVHMMVKY